uniref:La-related protein 1B-like n=1 Tax=Rhizophora mucronata TaxID=61149 RepID=A0A2P2MXX1_RHIMU
MAAVAVVVGITMEVGNCKVASLTLLHRLHHLHFLYLQCLLLVIIIWSRQYLIILLESLHIGATTGNLDQLWGLCLHHLWCMTTEILQGEAALDNAEKVHTITI